MTETIDDVMQCGYIKAKFALRKGHRLDDTPCYCWANSVTRPRTTENFIYVSFGHATLPSNEMARGYIATIQSFGGKITRLDFCIDYLGILDFDAFYELHDNDQQPTPSILKSPNGTTVYVGKRASGRLLRVYDKTAEILVKEKADIGFDMTRIEIEVKRNMIQRYLTLFMAGKTDEILADIQHRYGLHGFCESHKPVKPTHNRDKEGSLWDFVQRYKRILREAYLSDTRQFLRLLEVTSENST
ncbi:MAG: replication initiation factor domain-containing protein [Gammaproteobacteria bacterium]|nr:replication initiation factor domain-containing protein [Gammaproteobacteria bacterium]